MPNTSLAIPEINPSAWKGPDGKLRPEAWTALLMLLAVGGAAFYFWGLIVPFVVGMLIDTVHTVYLVGMLAAIAYLVFGKRPQLMFRVIIRKLTSLFVAVYPIEIIEDKLLQMKKRKEKMDQQVGLVRGAIEKLSRVMQKNENDYSTGMNQAMQAHKMAGSAASAEDIQRFELQTRLNARKAERRKMSNLKYADLMDRIQKLYKFLSRYSTNIQFLIDDTQDDVDQKKTEYETTQTAFGAMKQAMAVLKGSATEEDIYDQAFAQIENTISTQLGMMDDMQRLSQNFMDGMDVENGAVDEKALAALDQFEKKLISSGDDPTMKLLTQDNVKASAVPVQSQKYAPSTVTGGGGMSSSDFDDLLK